MTPCRIDSRPLLPSGEEGLVQFGLICLQVYFHDSNESRDFTGFFTSVMPASIMEQVLRHSSELMNKGKMKRDFANGSI